MASYPPFDLKQASQYDLSSYFGRVKHFYKLTDPRTLLASDEQVRQLAARALRQLSSSLSPHFLYSTNTNTSTNMKCSVVLTRQIAA